MNQLVYAVEVLDSSAVYRCPICLQPVQHKISHKGKAFFSHYQACGKQKIIYKSHSGETNEHKEAKKLFKQYVPHAQLEYWVEELQQQIDIFIAMEFPMILEIQRSVIPAAQLKQRHYSYLKLTPYVYWIGIAPLNSLSRTFDKLLLYYHPLCGYYRIIMNLKEEMVEVQMHLPLLYDAADWSCYLVRIPISQINLLRQISTEPKYFKRYRQPEKRFSNIERRIYAIQQNVQYAIFLRWLHSQSYTLHELPKWIFVQDWQCLLVKGPVWQLLCVTWITYQQTRKDTARCISRLIDLFTQLSQISNVCLLNLPLISDEMSEMLAQALVKCVKYFDNK